MALGERAPTGTPRLTAVASVDLIGWEYALNDSLLVMFIEFKCHYIKLNCNYISLSYVKYISIMVAGVAFVGVARGKGVLGRLGLEQARLLRPAGFRAREQELLDPPLVACAWVPVGALVSAASVDN